MTAEELLEFGDAEPGVKYVPRPGGYAIIFDPRGRLAVVATDEGLHLPGGGQEAGETPEAATVREVAEETGLEVALEGLIGVADELAFAPAKKVHYRKRCSFFRARVTGTCEPTETDHELKWMETASALRELHHEVQRWAVRKALGTLHSE